MRESLVQAAWPVALVAPPRRALTVDHHQYVTKLHYLRKFADSLIQKRPVSTRSMYAILNAYQALILLTNFINVNLDLGCSITQHG